jgi:segregation and condensation protein B
LFATTRQFLDDLGLDSLDELPVLDSPAQQVHLLASLGAVAEQPDLAIEPSAAEQDGNDTALPASAVMAHQPAHQGAADDTAQAVET